LQNAKKSQHVIEAKKIENAKDRVQKATGNRGKKITECKRQNAEKANME